MKALNSPSRHERRRLQTRKRLIESTLQLILEKATIRSPSRISPTGPILAAAHFTSTSRTGSLNLPAALLHLAIVVIKNRLSEQPLSLVSLYS